MKKAIVILTVLAVLVTGLAAGKYLSGAGDVRDVKRIEAECTLYTRADLETAMDIVEKTFWKEYRGCKLLSIRYDEVETLAEIERQRERAGELKLLILVSDYQIGERSEMTWDRGKTYHDWKWILRNDGDGWKLVNWGYA